MNQQDLSRCSVCGELTGTFLYEDQWGAEFTTVRCICEGITCRGCGKNKIRRPISNYYDEQTSRVWHTPYFGSLLPCCECRASGIRPWRSKTSATGV